MGMLLKIVIVTGALFSVVGCNYKSNGSQRKASGRVDSWFKMPPKSIVDKVTKDASRNNLQYCSVVPKMQSKAISYLQDKSLIRLADENLEAYCGRDKNSGINKKLTPFLVRALIVAKDATDAYSVTDVSNCLWIDNPALPKRGKEPITMERQALIVFLPKRPDAVYVTSGLLAE